jgi:hypothetical protein
MSTYIRTIYIVVGLSHSTLAKKVEMSVAAVGSSIKQGESIAKDGKFSLEK